MNKYLHGNGQWCAACDGTGCGEAADVIEHEAGEARLYAKCPECEGGRRKVAP